MKIAHFINSRDPGGAETLVLDLCTSLPSQVVFAFEDSWIYAQCIERGIPVKPIPHKELWSLKRLPLFAYKFSKTLKSTQVDILHTHLYAAALRGSVAARLASIPSLTTLHDTISVEEKPVRAKVLNVLSRLFGTKFVAISENVKRIHRELGSIRDIEVILNGVNINKFTINNSTRYNVRNELNIDRNETVVFTAGRLAPEKSISTLILATHAIHTEVPYKVVIAGTGLQESLLKELTKKLDIQDKVIFLGHRADVPALLAMSDIYVSTSTQEGLGISIQEAMASGLPVVATDVGGVGELIDHQKTGILINNVNYPPHVSVSSGIKYLLENPTVAKLYGMQGQAKAEASFSIQSTVQQYVQLYLQVHRNAIYTP